MAYPYPISGFHEVGKLFSSGTAQVLQYSHVTYLSSHSPYSIVHLYSNIVRMDVLDVVQ